VTQTKLAGSARNTEDRGEPTSLRRKGRGDHRRRCGLGRAYALLLAARGAGVVVNDLGGGVDGHGQSEQAAAKVVEEIRAAGGCAISNGDSVSNGRGWARDRPGCPRRIWPARVVINNAGILRDGALHKMTEEAFES